MEGLPTSSLFPWAKVGTRVMLKGGGQKGGAYQKGGNFSGGSHRDDLFRYKETLNYPPMRKDMATKGGTKRVKRKKKKDNVKANLSDAEKFPVGKCF